MGDREPPRYTPETLTYLVTGGAGFIGSHLAESLLSEGHRVLILDDLSSGSVANLIRVRGHPNLHFVRASISDTVVMDRLCSQADAIVHLAAAVGVKLILQRPVHMIETNVSGTEQVLRAALRYHCRVLIASTSEVYGKASKIPFSENDDLLLGPTTKSRWSYAAGKLIDEFLALAYHQESGLPVTIFRLFNTVGPRQRGRYGMVLPRFARQALCGETITVFGDGRQTRCFCDVRDAVEAILGLSRHPEAVGQVFNIGSTEEISIRGLAERVKLAAGSSSPIRQIPYEEAYAPGFEDMPRRVPDITRIGSLLGWKPRLSLNGILENVIACHKGRRARPWETERRRDDAAPLPHVPAGRWSGATSGPAG